MKGVNDDEIIDFVNLTKNKVFFLFILGLWHLITSSIVVLYIWEIRE